MDNRRVTPHALFDVVVYYCSLLPTHSLNTCCHHQLLSHIQNFIGRLQLGLSRRDTWHILYPSAAFTCRYVLTV